MQDTSNIKQHTEFETPIAGLPHGQRGVSPNADATDIASIDEQSDSILLMLIKDGDQQAYNAIVNRYLQPLWRLASNILNDQSEAEDVVQDLFLSLWSKKLNWEDKGAKFSTWLYRVVLNKCLDIKRKNKRRSLTGNIEVPKLFKDDRPGSDVMLEKKQDATGIQSAIQTLPDQQKRAMKLFYYEERSLKDIATELSTTLDGAKSLLKRARHSVRGSLNV